MAKWKPPHPAKWITAPMHCEMGQRYSSADKARTTLGGSLGGLTAKLKLVNCSQCQGGYHVVTADELFCNRNVLTEVPRYG